MNINLFLIDESEKIRILEMHQRATKKQYLSEQSKINDNPIYNDFYSKLGDKSKRYWTTMSDEEKNNILKQVQEKIDKSIRARQSQGKKNVNEKDVLNSIKSISITPDGTSTQSSETQQETITTEIPYTATYPDNTQQNPDLQNFYFGDDQVVVSESNVEKFSTMIAELKRQIPTNETIKEIIIKAGSTTSQVPTKYSGGEYSTIADGQKNNITLAEDRCKNIEKTLYKIVGEVFPNELGKVKIEKRDLKPNNGPEYTEKERTYFFSTGKLDPTKKTEYETKYGPYKGSYGSVMIVTEGTETITTGGGGEESINVNNWKVRFTWKNTKSSGKQKKKYRGSKGAVISVGGNKGLGLIDCPIW